MITEQPFISVVIITYNHGEFVGEAIQSVLDQTYPNIEVVVVDDGSTDNTREVVTAFGDRVRYIHQENQGRGASRNNAINATTHDWIAFLDSDDIWVKEKLAKQVAAVLEHPEIDALFTNGMYFHGTDLNNIISSNHLSKMTLLDMIPSEQHGNLTIFKEPMYRYFVYENFVLLSSCLIKKSCLKRVNLFDPTLQRCQDRDLWLRMSRHFKYAILDEILVNMREHSLSDGPQTDVPLKSRVQLFEKALEANTEWEKKYLKEIHEQLGNCYYELGHYRFFVDQDHAAARNNFNKAKAIGFTERSIGLLSAATYMPVPIINLLRKIKNSISG